MAVPAIDPASAYSSLFESLHQVGVFSSSNALLASQSATYTFSPSLWGRALVALLWAVSGLLAAYVMKRRGHEFRSLAALGLALGPLYIPLALQHARSEPDVKPLPLNRGDAGDGSVDVLIGLRGSADCVSDALPVIDLLEPRIGRVTIAAAVDYESAGSNDWSDAKSAAAVELDLASILASQCCRPETVIVPGPPDYAFVRYAQQNGHHLLLITEAERKADGSSGPVTTMLVSPTRVPS